MSFELEIVKGVFIGILVLIAQIKENEYPLRNVSTFLTSVMVVIWMVCITEPIFLVLFWNSW
jgi:hypothetical protein